MFYSTKVILVVIGVICGINFCFLPSTKPANLQLNDITYKLGEKPFALDRPNSPIIKIITSRHSSCTAFVVDAAYAVTAAHCVVDAKGYLLTDNIDVFDSKSEPTNIKAQAIGLNSLLDYAVISGNFEHFQALKSDFSSNTISYGKKYLSCGFPLSQKHYRCSQLKVKGSNFFTYTSVGMVFPGESGGPVIDEETNTVVGVNSAVSEDGLVMFNSVIGLHGAFGLE